MLLYLCHGARVWELRPRAASDPAARARGFAGRVGALAPDEAIFFVFPGDTLTPFTLAATGVPLDLVFFDAQGVAVALVPGVPGNSPEPVVAPRPFRYALELPAGWLAARGVAGPSVAVAWPRGSFPEPT